MKFLYTFIPHKRGEFLQQNIKSLNEYHCLYLKRLHPSTYSYYIIPRLTEILPVSPDILLTFTREIQSSIIGSSAPSASANTPTPATFALNSPSKFFIPAIVPPALIKSSMIQTFKIGRASCTRRG